jgi:hypothetical protein
MHYASFGNNYERVKACTLNVCAGLRYCFSAEATGQLDRRSEDEGAAALTDRPVYDPPQIRIIIVTPYQRD